MVRDPKSIIEGLRQKEEEAIARIDRNIRTEIEYAGGYAERCDTSPNDVSYTGAEIARIGRRIQDLLTDRRIAVEKRDALMLAGLMAFPTLTEIARASTQGPDGTLVVPLTGGGSDPHPVAVARARSAEDRRNARIIKSHAAARGAKCRAGADGTCSGCGVILSECRLCNGIGYHQVGCSESEE